MELETWFSGGGLADVGFADAGLKPVQAVELEESIASVYAQNLGNHIVVADVREYSKQLGDRVPFWFHASPPCTNASNAKQDAGETELDIELARAVVKGIERRSPWFSLENVWGYRSFESFRIICEALSENGYNFAYWHLNSADYGVPQTRKRLILVASRVKRVIQPFPTHSKEANLFALPWIGWYEAIADLIPSLPESQFAPWQIERLPEELKTQWHPETPQTFLTETKFPNRNAEKLWRSVETPSPTVTALNPNWRSFLVDSQNARTPEKGGLNYRTEGKPSFTMSATASGARAFLVDGKNIHPGDSITVRQSDEPHFTVAASVGDRPCHIPKAWLSRGRVVAMTSRCLARFQSLPDWYQLTGKNSLDCKIIGNGVPCLLMAQVVQSQQISHAI